MLNESPVNNQTDLAPAKKHTLFALAPYGVGFITSHFVESILCVVIVGSIVVREVLRRGAKGGRDIQFTGAFPRFSGAKSAVTGGPPEDMNGMPATDNPAIEGPIYDGADLSPTS